MTRRTRRAAAGSVRRSHGDVEVDAVVVGAGPNGLAAAVTLATAGLSVTVLEASPTIGGGTRTAELTVPGLQHDVCSAVHPLGAASPYLASLPLAGHGLEWLWPPIDLAHVIEGDRAAVMTRSIDETAAGLGPDAAAWQHMLGRLSEELDPVLAEIMRPIAHLPRHPVELARFGAMAVLPATTLARRFRSVEARALLAGCAAHSMTPLTWPTTAAAGLLLAAAGHRHGWPVARGGSQAITAALAGLLTSLGATVTTGVPVTSLDQLPTSHLTLLDTSPATAAAILGERLPPRVRRAYARWRHGPGAFKVDLAVEGGVPWLAEPARRAGTVHVGGTIDEVVAAEAAVHDGEMPARPFVLVAQQYLADPTRSVGDVHPVWAYAHVPAGYPHDATDAVIAQLERFAPGVRERIVGQHVMAPGDLAAYNQNYVGGDIAGGANDPRQLLARPRAALDPYWTGIPGVYLCSASTPPGAGVHGMCGHQAALRALGALSGVKREVRRPD